MRIDKFLWTVRLFKTRSLATKACQAGQAKLNNEVVKSSKEVYIGSIIAIRENPIWRSFKIIDIPKSRVGAKLVKDHVIEITKKEDLELLESIQNQNRENKILGLKGRPTKRERRNLDKWKE